MMAFAPATSMLVAAVELLPEHLAALRGESQSAWDYVFAGVRSTGLWLACGALLVAMTDPHLGHRRTPMERR